MHQYGGKIGSIGRREASGIGLDAKYQHTSDSSKVKDKCLESISRVLTRTLFCRYFAKIFGSQVPAGELSSQDIPLLAGALKEHT